ncbi:MAG TPA: hypothetical protein DDW42_06680 [Desulfobacteraceae bacterium]|nr:hypothetical protein [Desulfobacteraceae bacterium]
MEESEPENEEEKRTSRRISSLNLTSYIPSKEKKQEYIISIGRTLDMSDGGIKVETHRELSRGTEVDMEIAIENKIISARGEVVHSFKQKNGLFGTGICFTSIRETDRELLR